MNENQVIGLFSRQMCFRLLKKSNEGTQMCKIKYLLSYIHCSTWKIMICWHLQELSSNSKEQMKIARRCRYLGHLRSL